jgi:uncharacterized surface protein with fasciclin (FAS1) repeats
MSKNILETAREAGSFTTLLAAVDAAGLSDTLAGGGPFTVFAPTDEAFAKLPEGTVESLLADPAKLTDVLTYHVVPSRVTAADAAGLSSAPSGSAANSRSDRNTSRATSSASGCSGSDASGAVAAARWRSSPVRPASATTSV